MFKICVHAPPISEIRVKVEPIMTTSFHEVPHEYCSYELCNRIGKIKCKTALEPDLLNYLDWKVYNVITNGNFKEFEVWVKNPHRILATLSLKNWRNYLKIFPPNNSNLRILNFLFFRFGFFFLFFPFSFF